MAKILVAALASKADASVFEVPFETQADLCWYELPYRQQAEGDAQWCFVDYEADATFKIFRVKYATQADIKTFKVSKGKCYEIYGMDKNGKKVEIYFNPTDLKKVKEEIDE